MLEATEFTLLNRYQRGFPLVPRPYAEIGRELGTDEAAVIATYRRLAALGVLSRVGVVFRPNRVGASVLAALAVPDADLERVAQIVSAQAEVNHNYEREHRYNLWFVVAAADVDAVERALTRIEAATGLAALRLPLVDEYHIDLGFDLTSGLAPRCAVDLSREAPALGDTERTLVATLADGIPLEPEPYAALGRACGLDAAAVLALLRDWLGCGMVRRIGTVVRHWQLGFRANAMTVWDVPDEIVWEAGARLAAQAGVTLCYRRERRPPHWPYNLFCMVHGRLRRPVLDLIERLTQSAGLERFPREVLFSRRCFLQRGARYAAEAA